MNPGRRLPFLVRVALSATCLALTACGGGPGKSEALEAIRAGVTEDGSCTLPLEVMKTIKMQYASKGMCAPKEGAASATTCLEALAAAGLTTKLDATYLTAWPDEVAAASLADVPAYERRARSQLFSACWTMSESLREGRFPCAEVKADKVLRVAKKDETHSEVKYAREATFKPDLAAIEKACGAVSRPPAETSVIFTKGAAGWKLGDEAAPADAGSR